MSRTYKGTIFFWSIILSIYICAWMIQDSLFLNWDVSHLLRATRLMLAGGTYTNDFFIPNPPPILFLYTPPVLLSTLLGVHLDVAFRLYIFLIISIIFSLCCLLANRIFSKSDVFLKDSFLITLLSIFLIVPMFQFGQRDCLLLVLIMPYLLAITLRLAGKTLSTPLALWVGLLAGLGLAIKPQFLIIPFLIECYYIYHQRNLFAWIRAETSIIFLLFWFYAFIIMRFFPDFVFTVTPFILRNYYDSVGTPLTKLILYPTALFSLLPIPLYIVQYKNNAYKPLSTVLLIALIGFLISYFAQRTFFLYHLIPFFSLAILLLVLLDLSFILNPPHRKLDYFLFFMVAALFLVFLFASSPVVWTALIFTPSLFFGFFAVLFAMLLLAQDTKKIISPIFCVLLIISISMYTSFLAMHTEWHPYQFLITIGMLISLFSLLAARLHNSGLKQLFMTVFSILIFTYPVFTIANIYEFGVAYKTQVLNTLMRFMATQPPRPSIYVLSIMANYSAPLMDYTDAKLVERFDCLWMMNGFAKHGFNKDALFFNNMITADLHDHKPDLVFVDTRDQNIFLGDAVSFFDFIRYFSNQPSFRDEWRHYRYVTTIADGDPHAYNYKLQVYKRINAYD